MQFPALTAAEATAKGLYKPKVGTPKTSKKKLVTTFGTPGP